MGSSLDRASLGRSFVRRRAHLSFTPKSATYRFSATVVGPWGGEVGQNGMVRAAWGPTPRDDLRDGAAVETVEGLEFELHSGLLGEMLVGYRISSGGAYDPRAAHERQSCQPGVRDISFKARGC